MADLDPQQDDRYRFMDFLLVFKGRFNREEIVRRFSIGEATASRSIAAFLEAYPGVLDYLGPRKGYKAKSGFTSRHSHDSLAGLRYLASGTLHQKIDVKNYGGTEYNLHKTLNVASVSAITRAVVNQYEVSIQYVSTSSGAKTRNIAPHAVFSAGGTWYFRAYDFSSYEFRTFKFSRLESAIDMGQVESSKYLGKRDDAWHRMRIVQLVPHPKNPNPDAQLLDLGIRAGEIRELMVSEACLGFILNDLRVDCSKGNKLSWNEYPLSLKNRDELANIESIVFAPGFDKDK